MYINGTRWPWPYSLLLILPIDNGKHDAGYAKTLFAGDEIRLPFGSKAKILALIKFLNLLAMS
jgi:hypothetical protein